MPQPSARYLPSSAQRPAPVTDADHETIVPQPGDVLIDGGVGIDTVQLAGRGRADYLIRVEEAQIVLTSRADGASLALTNIERLQFMDGGVDLSAQGTITRMFQAAFGRQPDAEGLAYWQQAHRAGASLEDIAATFLASGEAVQHDTNKAFLDALYVNGLGQLVDLKQQAQWTWLADGLGLSRAELLVRFADWAPMLAKAAPEGITLDIADLDIGTIVRMYDALFDRAPDQAGLNYWIGVSEAGVGMAALARDFVGGAGAPIDAMSDAAYVAWLYQAGLERTAEEGEVAYWAGLLDSGALERGDVLLAIADSSEMIALTGMMSTSIDLA